MPGEKKRIRQIRVVDIPQEAFIAELKIYADKEARACAVLCSPSAPPRGTILIFLLI